MTNQNNIEKKYRGFYKSGQKFVPDENIEVSEQLPGGIYDVKVTRDGQIYFDTIKHTYDDLIDLPSPEYTQIVGDLEKFLLPETKAKFDKFGFIYKRSALLHGMPGTGKTCIVNRISSKVIADGGVVLFNPSPGLIHRAFEILDSTQPDAMVMIIFEEFDQLLEHHEGTLLNILDGEIQKRNVIYIATTNYIEQVPARIMRPGRFSTVIEVGFPNEAARRKFIETKPLDKGKVENLIKITCGLSIDEVKEVILATECLGYNDPVVIIDRIRSSRAGSKTEYLAEADLKKDNSEDW